MPGPPEGSHFSPGPPTRFTDGDKGVAEAATVRVKALKQYLANKDGTCLLDEAWIVQGDG